MEPLYKRRAVYQIYPRSFKDSNGDGIGDIPGIISKLDYLQKLGIGIIWLSPVYKTANADFGYDVSDYCSINPEYGTMEDMDRLIKEAGDRGIRIVMDLVVNHTSDEHEWFKKGIDPNSPYHQYYYWRKGKKNNTLPPNNWTSNFDGPAWTYVKEADEWYLHLFSYKQPDLDWHNPKVLEEVEKILRFWLDKGIYGFRCDVIDQIWKDTLADGKKKLYLVGKEHYLMREGSHTILRKLYEDVFSKYDCMTVGETSGLTLESAHRYTDRELTMCFQFDAVAVDKFLAPIWNRKYKPKRMKDILIKWQEGLDWNANFFENHDQKRSIERYGDAEHYWKESGKMLSMLLLTQRGTPYIYQGEEFGMLNMKDFETYVDPVNGYLYNRFKKWPIREKTSRRWIQNFNRDNARTPMQWDDSVSAGFSTSEDTWLPVNENYKEINASSQENDPSSILNFYRELLKIRNEDEVLQLGNIKFLNTDPNLIGYFREYEGKTDLILINLSNKERPLKVNLSLNDYSVILSNYEGSLAGDKKILRPYESILMRKKG